MPGSMLMHVEKEVPGFARISYVRNHGIGGSQTQYNVDACIYTWDESNWPYLEEYDFSGDHEGLRKS